MKITTTISVEFDTNDINMDTTNWTQEDFESYYVDTFIEDIHTLINNDDIGDMVSVEVSA